MKKFRPPLVLLARRDGCAWFYRAYRSARGAASGAALRRERVLGSRLVRHRYGFDVVPPNRLAPAGAKIIKTYDGLGWVDV